MGCNSDGFYLVGSCHLVIVCVPESRCNGLWICGFASDGGSRVGGRCGYLDKRTMKNITPGEHERRGVSASRNFFGAGADFRAGRGNGAAEPRLRAALLVLLWHLGTEIIGLSAPVRKWLAVRVAE